MSIETFKAVATLKEGMACEVEARGLKVTVDEPKEDGGTDTGMTPIELLLGSLGACQTILASIAAPHFGINLEKFWVEVEGDIDNESFLGKIGVPKGYQTIRFNFHIKSDASEEKIKKLIKYIENFCPVGATLIQGVKFEEATITVEK